ncbi:PSD1 domain-containing protein [bacterium]|nr:PSD1 domain-containing protein [bacterium]
MRHLRLLPTTWSWALAIFALGATHAAAADPAPEAVAFFETDVRPVLVAECQRCHGAKKQESGLRVDSRAALLKGGQSGPAVVPGKADRGTLLAAVRHAGELWMPPESKLAPAKVAALTKWVADGAAWPEDTGAARAAAITPASRNHWAFRPVADPPPPPVADAAWARTDLDRFVLARLEAQKLKPAAPADRRTLLRRATLDLTGLPPTPAEIAAFLADDSPGAYATVVDRLLASPAYGERWGRHWLDVARYADTAGDGADYPVREAYRYRDWVIAAFNADQPFDQFVREQVAGDVLARAGPPERYAARVTATGFLAVGKRYGYNTTADYQHLDFADAIESVGRSVLGLSLGCARCHDHKYDPVSVADYYGLYGILQSTRWAFPGGEEHQRPAHFPALVPPDEAARRDAAKAAELARLDGELRRIKGERAALTAFAGGVDLGLEAQAVGKALGGAWLSAGPAEARADAQSPFVHVHPPGTRGVRVGSGAPGDGVRHVFESGLRAAPGRRMHVAVDFRAVAPATEKGAHRFFLGRGVAASLAVECSLTDTAFAVRDGAKWEVVRALEPGTWYTLQLDIDPAAKTYAGRVGRPGDLTEFRGKATGPGWDGVLDTFICDGHGHVAGRPAVHDLDNLALGEAPFAAPGGPAVAPPAPPPDLKDRLAKLDADLAAATKKREAAAARVPYDVAYGVSEGVPANARIQKRGEPDKLGAEVPRRFLEVLGGDPVPPGAGSGRLELANWLTRPSNPLTARVFVNRVWAWHFGRGLVPTPSDFGTRGEPPSHPELLDWFAARFVQGGWSVKALHRLIVLSRTYQQASAGDPATARADPGNKWLARYPRRPLDAESIRDGMLAVSGLLNRTPPAGHPFPPVESWRFTIHNPFHAVYDSDHRSVYLMVQRSRRHPYLALFDAADPNLSTAERVPTVTPTQALYLMNSPFVHRQAEAFGRRLLAAPGDDTARARLAVEAAHGRPPGDAELADAVAFVAAYRRRLAGRGEAADAAAAGAWAALCRVLLTSNAFLYVD